MKNTAPSDSTVAFEKLQQETALRDFTIASETGKEWPVHKLILYIHSDVLFRMATSPEFIECQTSRAVLKDVPNPCLNALVHYFYTHILMPTVTIPIENLTEAEQTRLHVSEMVPFYAGMFVLADMYNIPALKQKTSTEFDDWLVRQCRRDKDVEVVELVLQTIEEVGLAKEEMRRHVVEFLARRWGVPGHPDRVEKAVEFLEQWPEVAREVAKAVVRRNCMRPSGGEGGWSDKFRARWGLPMS